MAQKSFRHLTTKLSLCVILAVLPTGVSLCQEKDFGLWAEIKPEFSISKRFDADISLCVRTFENAGKVEQYYAEASLTYKLNKVFDASIGYRMIGNLESDSEYHLRQKLMADLKAGVSAGDLSLSARLRLQNTLRSWVNDPEDLLSRYYTRLKLRALYDIPACKVNPFTSFETFSPLSGEGFEISKFRFAAGAEINLPGKTSFDLEWIYEHDSTPDLLNTNIISVTYNLKF